jgi:hypothetical protein
VWILFYDRGVNLGKIIAVLPAGAAYERHVNAQSMNLARLELRRRMFHRQPRRREAAGWPQFSAIFYAALAHLS